MIIAMILRYSMIQIIIVTSILSHLTYSYEMDDNNNKCLSEFGPIYCNLLEYANEQPVRMPTMQQLNQKRTLNKARNKLIKSSRFWGKRNVDTFNENESGLMPDTTNTDGPYRRLGHQKFGLALSSRFWG